MHLISHHIKKKKSRGAALTWWLPVTECEITAASDFTSVVTTGMRGLYKQPLNESEVNSISYIGDQECKGHGSDESFAWPHDTLVGIN